MTQAALVTLRQDLESLAAEARRYVATAKSASTRKAYRADWADFSAWCQAVSLSASPADPDTVALYLTHLARSRKTSTLTRRLAAISQFHQAMHPGAMPPTDSTEVRLVLSGIRRQLGTAPRRKRPLLGPAIARAASGFPPNLLGCRNRALLLVTYAGALRRSEAVALNWSDVEFDEGGLKIRLARSKTDQTGQGSTIGIPFGASEASCPVRALAAWRAEARLSDGPVFRVVGRAGKVMEERLSDKAVARLVKQTAARLGLAPEEFSAHSLRAGLATTAAANGASERKIMDQTRHRSLKSVRVYIRDGDLFRDNAAAKAGL